MADEATTTPPEGGKQDDAKTFTQEDVERIIGQRIGKVEQKYSDYDELKAKAAKADELEASQSSDLEKALKRAEKAESTLASEKERADAAVTQAQQNLTKAAVYAEASKRGVIDPDAAFQLLPKDKVTVGDDGQVTGVEDALSELLETRQYLVGNSGPGPGDGGARPPATPSGDDAASQHNQFLTQHPAFR